MKIEEIEIENIKIYSKNSKLHNAKQVNAISNSIQEFGFTNPILVDESNVLIAGHGRLLAAKNLNLKKVPCIRLSHLTEKQKKAYVIADNRLAEIGGGWDKQLLSIEIESLKFESFDISLIGFDLNEKIDITPKSREIDVNSFEFDTECPRCHYKFNVKL